MYQISSSPSISNKMFLQVKSKKKKRNTNLCNYQLKHIGTFFLLIKTLFLHKNTIILTNKNNELILTTLPSKNSK